MRPRRSTLRNVDNGADVVDAYPVDPVGTVSPIFAYPGIRSMYERAGFAVAARPEPCREVPGEWPCGCRSREVLQPSVTTVISNPNVISTRWPASESTLANALTSRTLRRVRTNS